MYGRFEDSRHERGELRLPRRKATNRGGSRPDWNNEPPRIRLGSNKCQPILRPGQEPVGHRQGFGWLERGLGRGRGGRDDDCSLGDGHERLGQDSFLLLLCRWVEVNLLEVKPGPRDSYLSFVIAGWGV